MSTHLQTSIHLSNTTLTPPTPPFESISRQAVEVPQAPYSIQVTPHMNSQNSQSLPDMLSSKPISHYQKKSQSTSFHLVLDMSSPWYECTSFHLVLDMSKSQSTSFHLALDMSKSQSTSFHLALDMRLWGLLSSISGSDYVALDMGFTK